MEDFFFRSGLAVPLLSGVVLWDMGCLLSKRETFVSLSPSYQSFPKRDKELFANGLESFNQTHLNKTFQPIFFRDFQKKTSKNPETHGPLRFVEASCGAALIGSSTCGAAGRPTRRRTAERSGGRGSGWLLGGFWMDFG